MANEITTVNATTGELEEAESRPVSQLVNTLNPKTFEERKAVFNAVNNAQSLDDMKHKPIKIVGVAQVHSVRVDRNTGEEVPCIGTTLVGADGTGYYSQSAGIARVKANGWFVEDIHRAHQTAPQRSSQIDTLRFATRKARRETVQGEITQTDIAQKLDSVPNLDQQPVGYYLFMIGKLQHIEKRLQLRNRQIDQFCNRATGNLDIRSLFFQPGTFALGASGFSAVAR